MKITQRPRRAKRAHTEERNKIMFAVILVTVFLALVMYRPEVDAFFAFLYGK